MTEDVLIKFSAIWLFFALSAYAIFWISDARKGDK